MVPVNFQERVASGDIPEDAAEITAGCKQLLRVNSRVSQTVAVCIAKMYEALDLREWVNWCRDELGLDSVSYRSHLAKVGKLLLSLLRDESALPTYTRLFECDVMKLLALARVPESEVVSFLSHNPDFERISRDELRRRVAEWLGEEVSQAPEQPELPGFEAALAAAASLPAESFADAVKTPEHAEQALFSVTLRVSFFTMPEGRAFAGASVGSFRRMISCGAISLLPAPQPSAKPM